MQRQSSAYVFLASPTDVSAERQHVHDIADELNRTVARASGANLEVISWEHDTYPSIGDDPQAIVNHQIAQMETFDLFVGIMWNRIGSPTSRAESGTVEEFKLAEEARQKHGNPDIWFYFSTAPTRLVTKEQHEWWRLVSFPLSTMRTRRIPAKMSRDLVGIAGLQPKTKSTERVLDFTKG